MPFLTALVPVFLALGASGTTAAALSIGIITSLIEIGANLLIGAVSKLFRHAPSVTGNSGSLLAVREPISFRRIIYGGVRVGSIITDMALTGTNNEYLHLILTIAGHEVDTLGVADPSIHRAIYLDGTVVELRLEGTTWHPVPGNKYRAHMLVEFDLGDPTNSSQPFPSFHTDAPAHWTSNHRQQGCAKVHLRIVWDATLFPSGIPQSIAFNVFGKKVFDPRSSTTAFSSNPALCVRDFLTDTQYGMGVDAATIDDASVIAAANICDEAVNLKAGGTQPRYTCDGTFDSSIPRGQVLASMVASMAGFVNAPGDKWRIFAGAYTDPVMSLTDSDLRGPIKWDARVSRRDLANAVKGTFTGPENVWQPSDFPPYESATYLTEDGGEYISQDIALDFTVNHVRAQRLAKIHLEKIRRQNQLVLPSSLAAYPLEPGDVIEFTHSRFGWTNKTFIVNNTSLAVGGSNDNITLGVDLTLTAIDTDVYAWDETTDEGDFTAPAATTLPDIGTVAAPTGLSLSNVEVTRADGIKALQIKASWTKPTDTHVLNGGKINIWVRERLQHVNVPATTIPWTTLGGQNSSYVWTWDSIGTDPVFIPLEAGDSITVKYLSGSGFYSAVGSSSDLDGDLSGVAGGVTFPASYGHDGPTLGVLGLIGTFVDELGNVITNEIHRIGNGPLTFTAPSGAKGFQLGLNDTLFGPGTGISPDGPNTGNFVVEVRGGQLNWRLAGTADGADTVFYIPGAVDGVVYDVKITAQNSYGAISPADEVDNFTATATSATFAGTMSTITQAADVVVTSPATNDVLKWDGTKWINGSAPSSGGVGTTDFSADGSSLSGWTLGSANPLVRTHSSNPRLSPPAIDCLFDASNNSFAHIDTGVSLAGKTILFDFLAPTTNDIGYLIFGVAGAGTGNGVFLDFRVGQPSGVIAHFTGFKADAYVDSDNNDLERLSARVGHWLSVKVVIDGPGTTATVYINGTLWSSAAVALVGQRIAIGCGSVAGGVDVYFRNIIVGH